MPNQPRDLITPDPITPQNLEHYTVANDPYARTAADYKDLVRMFHDRYSFDELRQLPIVPVGMNLKEGAVYLDLAARDSGPFVAHARGAVREDQYLIPKAEVPYELWNRLTNMQS